MIAYWQSGRRIRGKGAHDTTLFVLLSQYTGMFLLLFIPVIYSHLAAKDDRWEAVFRSPYISLRGSVYVVLLTFVGMKVFLILGNYMNDAFVGVLHLWPQTIYKALESQLEESEQHAEFYATIGTITTSAQLLLDILICALLPAVVEEVLFRGFLQVMLVRVIRHAHLTIFLAGFAFSLWHKHFPGLVHRTLVGMFLGYLYHYTGSLFYPFLAHFKNNAYVSLCQYTGRNWLWEYVLPQSLRGIVFTFVFLWYMFIHGHRREQLKRWRR